MKNKTETRNCGRNYSFLKPKTLLLTGCAVAIVLCISSLALYTRKAATQELDKNMPTLKGDQAVEYLKEKSHDNSLANAFKSIVADDLRDSPEAMAKLTPNDGIAGGQFGSSVAISGNTAIIGATNLPQGNGGTIPGAAYIFVRNGASWAFQQKLTAPDSPPNNGNAFGDTVAISGDTVVVAAPQHNAPESTSGAVYVFVRTGTTWTLQKRFTNADTPLVKGGKIGFSAAISGDTVLVTAFGFLQFSPHRHLVHVFVRAGTTWTLQATLITGGDDTFSARVAISGNMAVIGNPSSSGTRQEAAFIFVRCGTEWTQQQRLTQSDGSGFEDFGGSVAISGNTVIVGASKDAIGTNQRGSAYIYVSDGTTWTEQAKLTGAVNRLDFGQSVAILGDTAVIGAPSGTFQGGTQAGAADVFVRNGTTWTRDTTITAPDGQPSDYFGWSVAISSELLFVGAIYDDFGANNQTNEGSAWAIDRTTAEPPPTASPCEDDIEVNITTDQVDADLEDDECDVNLTQSDLQCSLRAAIQTANAKEGPDEIVFDIPGGGVRTINVVTFGLPDITETTSIDGTTQPGYSNLPVIEIRGDHTNTGLRFMDGSAGSVLKGVTINGFAFEGVFIATADNRVENCIIGLLADGQTVDPNQTQSVGIKVRGPRNTIGGLRADGKPVNIISGNFGAQIEVSASFAADNVISGNSVGYFADGKAVQTEAGFGIRVTEFARRTTIGGTVPGSENRVTAKDTVAILMDERSRDNKILQNVISDSEIGIRVDESENNTIGGERGTSRNIITRTGLGVYIGSSIESRWSKMSIGTRKEEGPNGVEPPLTIDNKVYGNDIGTCGNSATGNEYGVVIAFAGNTRIGDDGDLGNCISGNSVQGVTLDAYSVESIVKGNKIGVNFGGNLAEPNGGGLVILSPDNQIIGNIISGNTGDGIYMAPFDDTYPVPTGNTLQGNRIGTGLNTNLSIGNGGNGIAVEGDENIFVDNVISANTLVGIDVVGDDNQILNNKIGTNLSGSTELTGQDGGIFVVGSTNRLAGNVVSGNQFAGITIAQDSKFPNIVANENKIEGNYIGTNSTGTTALPGQSVGVLIANGASLNTIGGTFAQAKNVISGNSLAGILIQRGAGATSPSGNRIQGNYIGTNAAGIAEIQNGFEGIRIDNASLTLIGGFGPDMPAARNIISGNGRNGIALNDGATRNRISGNYVGTKADGATPLGNVERGIRVGTSVSGTIIGGPEPNAGNTIAFNGSNGISLTNDAGNNNIIDPNRIFGNVLAGIDIGENGFTPNDPTDADVGPNKLQNYPTMTLAIVGGDLIVSYQVDSAPQHSSYGSPGIYVEFFEADATGAGRDFLGSDHFLLSDYTNGTPGTRQKNLGNAVALGVVAGDKLTATATDAEGNSSEFTPAVNAPGGAPGFEGDVAPRPNGDGNMLSTDITQMRRFVSGLDTPNPATNEAQRIDCAPRSTFGDGIINSSDVVQGRRYVSGLDVMTPAGGPASRGGSVPESVFIPNRDIGLDLLQRELSIGEPEFRRSTAIVPIELTSHGNEVAMSFTLEYDQTVLANPRITLGKFAPAGSTLTVNTTEPGRIGILIDSTESIVASATPQQLLSVTFEVREGGVMRTVSFTDSLASKGVSDAAGNSLTTRYLDGNVILPSK